MPSREICCGSESSQGEIIRQRAQHFRMRRLSERSRSRARGPKPYLTIDGGFDDEMRRKRWWPVSSAAICCAVPSRAPALPLGRRQVREPGFRVLGQLALALLDQWSLWLLTQKYSPRAIERPANPVEDEAPPVRIGVVEGLSSCHARDHRGDRGHSVVGSEHAHAQPVDPLGIPGRRVGCGETRRSGRQVVTVASTTGG